MRKRYEPLPFERMLSMWRSGMTDRAIAEELDEDPQTITRWRCRNRIPVNRNHNPRRGPGRPVKYRYDIDYAHELIVTRKRPSKEVASMLGVSIDVVYSLRKKFGVAKVHPMTNLPPFDERLRQAKAMLDDGVSYAEAARSAHVSRKTIEREFPGYTWSREKCIEHALSIRYAEARINKVWAAAGRTKSLTNPLRGSGGS